MKEENIDLIVKTLKEYKKRGNLEDILKIVKGYGSLGFFEEAKRYIEEFLEKGGSVKDLVAILKDLPMELKNVIWPSQLILEGEFDADSFLEMGTLLWEIGSPDEAKENYLKAFEFYVLLGNRESAEQVLKILRENYPEDEGVKKLVFRDVKEEILSRLKSFIPPQPDYEIDLRYALARAFHKENLLQEAESNYRRILELDSSHNSKRLLVALLRERGSLESSLFLARELEGIEKLEELYSISQSFRNFGKLEEARSVLREIYEIDPDFKNVRELLGIPKEVRKEEKGEEKVPLRVTVREKVERDIKPEEGEFKEKKIVFL
ncbi:MAG: hypothetical protein ABIN61_05120 [candidate division WOR-3 bacterium]